MRHIPTYCITLLFLFHCTTTTLAQAPAPAPAGPLNVTTVLEKAGQFTTLIRLLKSSQVADQINIQLNNSNTGITLFAPTDNAFSSLAPGTLNSITDQQKMSLLQFHVLPSFVSTTQFQTVSNPLRTQAGDTDRGRYPLNVTTSGNQVNITTGVVNATVGTTIYSDGQLAVYQVDKVLLPLELFGAPAPASAPAPAASKPKKAKGSSISDAPSGSSSDSTSASSGISLKHKALKGLVVAAAAGFFWWTI